jgi:hypothetical protein
MAKQVIPGGAGPLCRSGTIGREESKAFFFEKKNQKKFTI